MLNRNELRYKKTCLLLSVGMFCCFQKFPQSGGWRSISNKRKTAVENMVKTEKSCSFRSYGKNSRKAGVFCSKYKKKKSGNLLVTGFFDSESDEFEPLHGTRGTVSVTKHVGK